MGLRGRGGSGRRRAPLRRAGTVGLVAAVFLGAGAASTWPALGDARGAFLAEGLPGRAGSAAPGDHLQTIWQLWLPGHQAGRGAAVWLDPYSFQPEVEPRVNFAAWPFGAVFWPLHALLGTVEAWNAFVLLGYLGAGVFAFLWLRALGLGVGAALVGGLAFALAPHRAAQAGAGHLLAWISMLLPLALWAWERRWYPVAAAALASIPLSGQVHLALGAVPFFVAYALVRHGDRRWAAGSIVSAVAAGALVWAVSVRESIGESRSFAQVERYSAELTDFVARDPRHGLEAFVLLGWLTPALAITALAVHRTRTTALLAVAAVVTCLLALGANLPGYEAIWRHTPGLGSTRVPGRLLPIACLAIAGLAAFTVDRLARDVGYRRLVAAAALALVALDLRAGVSPFRATPADEHNRAYAELPGGPAGRLLEVPVHPPDSQQASVYLYYAMQAPRERPAGYSTVAPRAAARVLEELRPCTDVRDLGDLGVRLLAVHGRPRCGVPGRLLARDGPIALYEAYIPVGW